LSGEEEAVAIPYRKLLQMMISVDAVRRKMTKDNISENITMDVLGPSTHDKTTKPPQNALSEEEEKIADVYRKMLKMMIPPDDVWRKMMKVDVSEKIIIAIVLGDDSKDEKAVAAQSKLRGSNLVSLQWTPLSGEELDNSVWRANKKRKVSRAHPEKSDISKLVQHFQKKATIRAV
jgi:hypothetical protein